MASRIRNPYNVVQSKSIHSSLTNLTKETDDHRQAARSFESKFHQLSRELTERYRPQHKQLLEQIREARVIAGRTQQQSRGLATEKARLNRQLQEESQQLKEACEEETSLLQEETERKRKYVSEMQEMNQELSSILKSQEEERLLEHLGSLIQMKGGAFELLDDALSSGDAELTAKGKAAMESMLEAFRFYENVLNETGTWQAKVHNMQASVLKHHEQSQNEQACATVRPNCPVTQSNENKSYYSFNQSVSLLVIANQEPLLTETSLYELERVWEETWNDDGTELESGTVAGSMEQPEGKGSLEETNNDLGLPPTDSAGVAVETLLPNVETTTTTTYNGPAQEKPVHMQLFYETTVASEGEGETSTSDKANPGV